MEFLDLFGKGDFGVVEALGVQEAFGIDETDVLLAVVDEPEDEVGVEVARLEEADALFAPEGVLIGEGDDGLPW